MPFLRSIGVGGMLIPLVSVLVAITLLPVVLATVGPWLDWPRNRREAHVSHAWTAWARIVIQRRWIAAGAALLILGALLVSAFSLNPGDPQADALAQSGDARRRASSPWSNAGIGAGVLTPIYALAAAGGCRRGRGAPGAGRRRARQRSPRMIPPGGADGTALITVIPTADANSQRGPRDRSIASGRPRTAGRSRRASAAMRAANADFVAAVYGNFPLMIALIAVVTFLLLARAFRSLLLPLKAVLLNVLSVGGAWGILVAHLAARLRLATDLGHRRDRLDHGMGAADGLRLPLRPLDGLRGLHPGPDARGVRPDRLDRRGGGRGHRADGAARHLRGADPHPRLRLARPPPP